MHLTQAVNATVGTLSLSVTPYWGNCPACLFLFFPSLRSLWIYLPTAIARSISIGNCAVLVFCLHILLNLLQNDSKQKDLLLLFLMS